MTNFSIIKKIELKFAVVSLCKDETVRILVKSGSEITTNNLDELFSVYNELVQGKRHPFIYILEDDSIVITKEVRTYFRASEKAFPKTCIAIIAASLPIKLMANFYLKFHKPTTNIKIFNNELDATKWCYQEQSKLLKN